MTRAVVFDLDGTLVDSAPDLHAALVRLLAEDGLPGLSLAEVKKLIGHGVPRLVESGYAAVGAADATRLAERVKRFSALYEADVAHLTRPYPDVAETLARLAAGGWRLGVCTNKPTGLAISLLAALGLDRHLEVVVGGDAAPRLKPDPAPLRLAVDRLSTSDEDVVYVGDSDVDVATARAAGLPVFLVRHGYTREPVDSLGADLVLDHFSALPAELERRAAASAAVRPTGLPIRNAGD